MVIIQISDSEIANSIEIRAVLVGVHRWLNLLQGRDNHPGSLDVQVVGGEHVAHGIVFSVGLFAALVELS